jgi:hypothetical protein
VIDGRGGQKDLKQGLMPMSIEQPTKFDFMINLTTAKALGLTPSGWLAKTHRWPRSVLRLVQYLRTRIKRGALWGPSWRDNASQHHHRAAAAGAPFSAGIPRKLQ